MQLVLQVSKFIMLITTLAVVLSDNILLIHLTHLNVFKWQFAMLLLKFTILLITDATVSLTLDTFLTR